MPLPSSGSISLGQVSVELGRASNATTSLGETAVRTLFGVPSGQISMSQGYGKANQFSFTVSSNQTNADLRTLAINAGWNQITKVVATIASGVYISSNSTSVYALTVSGSFPGGVELVNNGIIVGMGGAGGNGANPYAATVTPGSPGGAALYVSSAISIRNNNTIAGGGGGGGGGGIHSVQNGPNSAVPSSGGGGGGGRSSAAANSAGGIAGTSFAGVNGTAGTVSAAGTGGLGGGGRTQNKGGDGGDWGTAGAAGGAGVYGGNSAGGAGGNSVVGNGNITWLATGTRLGAIG